MALQSSWEVQVHAENKQSFIIQCLKAEKLNCSLQLNQDRSEHLVLFTVVCVYVCVCTSMHSVMSDSATPWSTVRQTLLSMGFSRQGCWSGLPCPPPGDLPNQGMEPRSPALQVDSLSFEPQEKPMVYSVFNMAILGTLSGLWLSKCVQPVHTCVYTKHIWEFHIGHKITSWKGLIWFSVLQK